MENSLYRKALVVVIIILFFRASVVPNLHDEFINIKGEINYEI